MTRGLSLRGVNERGGESPGVEAEERGIGTDDLEVEMKKEGTKESQVRKTEGEGLGVETDVREEDRNL